MGAQEQTRLVWRNRLWLLALWLLLYGSVTLFAPPLLDDADSVHAEVAREMLLRHNFVTLYANGIRYLEKAPLYYWLMALSMRVLGVSAAAARVPLAAAVAGLVLLLEAFTRRALNARAGLYAGLITLSSFGIFIFSRIDIPDVLVCVWLVLALYAYWRIENPCLRGETWGTPAASKRVRGAPHLVSEMWDSWRWCWVFAAACALDVLTKGLIGIVFPAGIVLLHVLLTRGWRAGLRHVRGFHLVSSAGVFAAIAVPWHVLVALANPSQGNPAGVTFSNGHFHVPLPVDGHVHGWAWFYFVNEQVLRYLNLRVPRDYDTVPLWLFLGLTFVWLMPWSAYLPAALRRALPVGDSTWRQRLRLHCLTAAEQTDLLLVLWAALPLAFFSLSTRQEYYVLPSLPPMIMLLAVALAQGAKTAPENAAHRSRVDASALVLALLGVVAGAVCVSLLLHTRQPSPGTDLASLLQQNPADYALSFGHFLDLNAQALGMFRLPLALTAVAFGLGLPAAWLLRQPRAVSWVLRGNKARVQQGSYARASVYVTAAAAVLFCFAAWLGLRIFSPALTSAQLAATLAPRLQPGDMIAIHGEYEAGSTLGFYLRRNDLHLVEGRSSNLWYGSFFADAPKIFETRDSIAAKWAGPQRIFLWEDPSDRERPVLVFSAPVYVIASSGGKRILSNRP